MSEELRRSLVSAAADLHAAGLIGGTAGNMSARLSGDRVLVTPTGPHKGRLAPDDLLEMALDAPAEEIARATSEFPFHRACYRADPTVEAVLHTHAPALIACGVRTLDIPGMLPEVVLATGPIATVPLLDSGSEELGRAVGDAVASGAGVVLLLRHGAISVGGNMSEALDRMELAELAAYAVLLAEDGSDAVLPDRLRRVAEGRAEGS